MDEQIEKQKIRLNETAPQEALNTESDPIENEELNCPRTPLAAAREDSDILADQQLSRHEGRQTEQRSTTESNVQSKNYSISEASQAVSSLGNVIDTQPRNWLAGILLFLTVNSYVAIMTLFTQVMAKGGFEAWLELVRFNGLEILGFFAFGPKQFAEHWASMGSFHLLFLSLIVYWSLFILYPMAILANDVFHDRKSTKERWTDVAIVLVCLACFIPLPCFPFWRNGGLKCYLGITKTSNYDARLAGVLVRVKSLKFARLFPEALSQSCEYWFNAFLVFYITRYCLIGPMQFRMSDSELILKAGICVQIGFALYWSLRKNAFIKRHDPAVNLRHNGMQIAGYTIMSLLCVLSNCNHTFKQLNQTTLILSCVLLAVGVVSIIFHDFRPAWLRRLVDKEDMT